MQFLAVHQLKNISWINSANVRMTHTLQKTFLKILDSEQLYIETYNRFLSVMIAFQSLVQNHFTGKSDRAKHVYDLRLEICRVELNVCSG